MTDSVAQSVTMARADEILDAAGVAAELGISLRRLETLRDRTRKRKSRGLNIRPEDFPLPDDYVGRSPWWYTATITRYKASTERNP